MVIDITNKNRATLGEISLISDGTLSRAAQMKADDMARRGYFSHTGPGGEAPWTWFERAGYDFLYAGENLAVNFIDSEDVVSAWMKSETHKKNILNGKFREIGIGVSKGKYEGRNVLFLVQFFGTPAKAAVSSPKKTGLIDTKTEFPKVDSSKTPPVSSETEKSYLAFVQQIATRPHAALNSIYIVLITMISLAFSLMIFIKFHIQHPRLILNGAVMLLFIGSLFVLNHYLTLSQIKIF
jgi:hypothetical protein